MAETLGHCVLLGSRMEGEQVWMLRFGPELWGQSQSCTDPSKLLLPSHPKDVHAVFLSRG